MRCIKTDLTGKKIENWTVIKRDLETKSKNIYWICECKCGFIGSIRDYPLKKGKTTSCGCQRTHFEIGYTFNSFQVIGKDDSKLEYKTQYWLCKCSCGNICSLNTNTIHKNRQKSCGCLVIKKWAGESFKKTGEINSKLWRTIVRNAYSRGLEHNITPEYIWNLFLKQNRKCALSGIELTFNKKSSESSGTASLDRIDSNKGYLEDNVQWVHKDINFMKQDFNEQYFLEICFKINDNMRC